MSMKIDPAARYSLKAIRRINKIPPRNSNYVQKHEFSKPDLRACFRTLDKLSESLKVLRYFIVR